MSQTQTLTPRAAQLDTEVDLGEGTSSGFSYKGLAGSRPLTIASLLDQPIVFVKQQQKSKSDDVPYKPINQRAAPPASAPLTNGDASAASPKPALTNESVARAAAPPAAVPGPPFSAIDPSVGWAKSYQIGAGLENLGNTCFLNSALQCLLHTPPLVRYAEEKRHDAANCRFKEKKGFCMTCAYPALVEHSFKKNKSAYAPTNITKNLRRIAQHFRLGRQEDSHEFLRFCIDNMQLSEMFGKDPKLSQAIKDSTFVHQIFGGRLRSRVKCLSCDHPSDTFDSVLDLSLDLPRGIRSVKEALGEFTKIDYLKGQNKYKCEKCKKLVNAEKSFTIDQAPMVLTIHLKRFTVTGRKINEAIAYPEILNLGPYMSDRSPGPSYRLYGIVNHSGGGPHSGHYTANVKSPGGEWHSMNDSFVSPCQPPLHAKNAYILFYCREKGQMLSDAINSGSARGAAGGGKKKRPRESMDGGAGSVKGSPSAQSWKGIPNGIGGSPSSSHGPSPAKKQHLQNSKTGPRPPAVLASSALASAAVSAFPPSDDDSPTPTTTGKGVFASRVSEGMGGMSKKDKRREQKQRKLGIQAVGKMKIAQGMKPRTIRE